MLNIQVPREKIQWSKKAELQFLKMLFNAICKNSLVPVYVLLGSFVWNVDIFYVELFF